MNKRIVIFGITAGIGGIETYLRNFQKAMSGTPVIFDFLLWHDTEHLPFEDELTANGSCVYRELYRLHEYSHPDAISVKELYDRHSEWEGIYLNVSRIDVTYLLLYEAYRRKLPYRIIHCHSSRDANESFRKKIWKSFYKVTNHKVVTHRFACSSIAGEWMFGNTPFQVLPDSVDFEKYMPDEKKRQAFRYEYRIRKNEIVVGFCGRLCYQKNPGKVVDIFRCIHEKIADSKLLLVGDGEFRKLIAERVESMGLTSNVIFAGSQPDTSPFYQMMDCFLLPSRFEGLGIVLLEAQAAGLRCYTSRNIVPQDTNVTGRVRYLDLDMSSEAWADIIIAEGFDRQDSYQLMQKSEFSLENLARKFTEAVL